MGNIERVGVRTVCKECGRSCPLMVYVEEGRAVDVEVLAPASSGAEAPCRRAKLGLERMYSPYRLLYPLKRQGPRGEGRWARISWEQALEEVAAQMAAAKEKQGAESVCLAKGLYERHSDYVSRLGNVFGTPNVTSIDNTCYIPSAVGRLVTYGFDGIPDVTGGPECVLLWGTSADPPLAPGTRLVVVDALETATARKADVWLQPRPGSDLALALAMLHVIVEEKLCDPDFVASWTFGFERLEEHVHDYSRSLVLPGFRRRRSWPLHGCSLLLAPAAYGTATPARIP